MLIDTAVVVRSAAAMGQDRAMAVPRADGWLVAVVDGAGGMGGGAAAADGVIRFLEQLSNTDEVNWAAALVTLDSQLSTAASGGQTTAVVALVNRGMIYGASVGDSAAWVIAANGKVVDLTAHQNRRPLLGTGDARPVAFNAQLNGRLMLASDGLVKYAAAGQIARLAMASGIQESAEALVGCVRLPSGLLQDDVAVVLVSP